MRKPKIRTALVAFIAALSVAIVTTSTVPSDSQARPRKPGQTTKPRKDCAGPNFPGGVLQDGHSYRLRLAGGGSVYYSCVDGTYCYSITDAKGNYQTGNCRQSPAMLRTKAGRLAVQSPQQAARG